MGEGTRKLRLGVAGLGRAFAVMLPTFLADRRVALVAAADPRTEARARFAGDFSARTYETVEELCADPAVEIVYVATPHQHHAVHALLASQHGKHALVEKPMAIALDDCAAMIAAARRAGVHLVVGHSHSFDAPILRTRELIMSGAYGAEVAWELPLFGIGPASVGAHGLPPGGTKNDRNDRAGGSPARCHRLSQPPIGFSFRARTVDELERKCSRCEMGKKVLRERTESSFAGRSTR